MPNDGWMKEATSRNDETGEPVYSWFKKGAGGGLRIDKAGEFYTVTYRINNETAEGYVYRIDGIHQRFTTLSNAKKGAEHADTMGPPN